MTNKLRVGVLFGGQSGEHEVSIVSARAVLAGLDRARYEVTPIGITKDGRWIVGEHAPALLTALADQSLLPGGPSAEAHGPAQKLAALAAIEEQGVALTANWRAAYGIDVVFPVLHGPKGEDGTVQGVFELAGVPYVGCGVLASAVSMDKAMMKAAFAAAGLDLVPWTLVRRVDFQTDQDAVLAAIETQLRYPVFVKPANMGSSVGISKCRDREELRAGLTLAAGYDRRIVVEQGLNVREIEVAVLGNETIEASVAGEVVPSNEWYDYEAKYLAGKSQILIPAPLDEAQSAEVRRLAVQAFQAVDGAGLARVDFLLDKDSGRLYANEVNTLPGFTPVSMYAKMWEATGLSYPALLDKLIALALVRHRS